MKSKEMSALHAMPGALQYAEVNAPRSNSLAVLRGHDARQLVEMSQVMSGPGSQQRRKRYWPEHRMTAAALQILWPQVQALQAAQIVSTPAGKLIEELRQRFALHGTLVPGPIERREASCFAEFQQEMDARHPIRLFAMDEMADDIEGAPGIFTLIAQSPGFRQIAKERVESSRSSTEKGDGIGQVVFHDAPP